ncbi:MAG: hypothetical protein LBG67_04875 [Campylobacteraceae bacterium]|jgi:NADH-quinone oxidoreductase subunit F|nr:hypothetical protein [Campylobacteraceae bacterium]
MAKNIFKEKLIEYGVNIDKIDANSPVILIGTLFSKDNEELAKELKEKQDKIVYCSALDDTFFHIKNYMRVKYEVGAEVGLLALLAKQLFEDSDLLCEKTKEYLDELDDGYLSAESNISEEEISKIAALIKNSSKCTLLFGEDIYNHPNTEELAGILSILVKYKNLHVSLLENLSHLSQKNSNHLPQIDELKSYDGTIVYLLPNQEEDKKLFGSAQFGIAAKIEDGDIVEMEIDGKRYKREFCLRDDAKGTVAILPLKESFEEYRFKKTKITKRVLNEQN